MTMNSGGEKLSEGWSREEEIDPAVGALTRLERSWTLSSQDSVQQWIDSLTEAELRNALDEESETTPRATPTQKFSEVYFLPLPGSLDYPDDDLALGAEAKSMSPGNSLSPYSPRLSPIGCIDDNEFSPRNTNYEPDSDLSKTTDENFNFVSEHLPSSNGTDKKKEEWMEVTAVTAVPRHVTQLQMQTSFESVRTTDSSILSNASIAGFLAALECDAEDVLKGLGFRDQSDSPVARIPRRFFFSPSSAKGIDPKDCYDSFIDDEEEVSPYSVELSCNAISEVLNKREIKFTKFVVDKCRYLFRYSMPNTSPTMTKVSELDRKTPVILPALSGTYVMVDKTDKRFVRFLMKVGRLNADARSTKSSRYSRG